MRLAARFVRERVEDVVHAELEAHVPQPVGESHVQEPLGRERLVVFRHRVVDPAVTPVTAGAEDGPEILLTPISGQPDIVPRLRAFQPAPLQPVEERLLESGELRRRRRDPRDRVL